MEIKIGKEFCEVFSSEKQGNENHGEYIYHCATYSNTLEIDEKEFSFCYQTGQTFNYGDYDCPTNSFSLYKDSTDKLLRVIYELGDATDGSFESSSGVSEGWIQEKLEEIEKIYSVVDSSEKAKMIYDALCDEYPNVHDFVYREDYELDEEGNVKFDEEGYVIKKM